MRISLPSFRKSFRRRDGYFGVLSPTPGCDCAPCQANFWCFSQYGVSAGIACGDDQGLSEYTSPTGASSDGHMDVIYPFVSGFDYSSLPFTPCTNLEAGGNCNPAFCTSAGYNPASGLDVTSPGGGNCVGLFSYFDYEFAQANCGLGGNTCLPLGDSPGGKVGAFAQGFKFSTNIPYNIGKAVYTASGPLAQQFNLVITDVCRSSPTNPTKGPGCSSAAKNFFYLPPPPLSLASSFVCSDASGTVNIPLGAYYFLVGGTPDQTDTLQTCQVVNEGNGTSIPPTNFCYSASATLPICMSSGDPFDGDPP